MYLFDSFRNLVAGFATRADKSSGNEYVHVSLDPATIMTAYRGSWVARKIIRIPANDATKKWRSWNASKNEITAIENVERKLRLQARVKSAIILARLFGGSALLINTRDKDLSFPVKPDLMTKDSVFSLSLLSKYQIAQSAELDQDPKSEYFGTPKHFDITLPGIYHHERVHPSRLVFFFGARVEDPNMSQGEGFWGDPILDAILQTLHQTDATFAAVASMVFESKIDILKIPDMMRNLGDKTYEKKLTDRVALSGLVKGINSTLMMDQLEDFEQKQLQFGSIPDIMDRFMQNISGAADIPMTRLWGRSPAGMNSTGESDLRNYYDNVGDIQSNEIGSSLAQLDEMIIRSALGNRPEEITYTWRPLWQSTEAEKAEIFSKVTDGISKLSSTKLINPDAVAKAAVNMLIESELMPGLEAAIDELGIEKSEEDLQNEELLAAALGQSPAQPQEPTPDQAPNKVVDASPRTLYVRRDVVNSADIVRWAKSQGINDTLSAGDLHVTIAYSRTPVDWMKVGDSWEEKIEIAAGGPRMVEKFGEALVLMIPGRSLHWRHQEIIDAGASYDFYEYQPHITISYSQDHPPLADIRPYEGRIVLGPEIFEEIDENWKDKVKK